VVVGQGDLIGKPLVNLLLQMPVTLTVCGKDTRDLPRLTRQAEILITGVGKANLISADMVSDGAVVVDAGVSFKGKKMYGDVDFDAVSKKAKLITPTPGGVGPITVAKLLENTVMNEIQKIKIKNV
jgi:methylenetetrahydrofolate dehydrogenase (NADP+)/methenyltetrahydrofolate cyclohydrolase